jgi:hypothetical protein
LPLGFLRRIDGVGGGATDQASFAGFVVANWLMRGGSGRELMRLVAIDSTSRVSDLRRAFAISKSFQWPMRQNPDAA